MTRRATSSGGRAVSLKRLLTVLVVFGGLSLAGWQAWEWRADVRCTSIVISGAQHASHDALLALAQVAEGDRLYAIDTAVAADRLVRHPWVAQASLVRLPTGTLRITVRERNPIARVTDDGVPARSATASPSAEYYLDANGFSMPPVADTTYHVPRLRGLPGSYHPVRPLSNDTTRAMLRALAEMPDRRRRLVAGLQWRDEMGFVLETTPTRSHPSIVVRLGHTEFGPRLERLYAFWRRAVMTQPETHFDYVDLRFKGQIVAREDDA